MATLAATTTPPRPARDDVPPSSPPPAPVKPGRVRAAIIDAFQKTVRFASLPEGEPGCLDADAVADRLSYDLFDTDDYVPPPCAPRVDTVILSGLTAADMETRAHAWSFPDDSPPPKLPRFEVCGTVLRGKAVLFRYNTQSGTVQPIDASEVPKVAWLSAVVEPL